MNPSNLDNLDNRDNSLAPRLGSTGQATNLDEFKRVLDSLVSPFLRRNGTSSLRETSSNTRVATPNPTGGKDA